MRITDSTLYVTLKPHEKYLTDKGKKAITDAAEARYGAMYDLTFAQFYAVASGDYKEVIGEANNPTVLQVYWLNRFEEFVTEFANELKRYTPPQTAAEAKASNGLLKTDFGENMLVFLQSYFGLKSFKEAEQITTGEILIAKRAEYNRVIFQRNLQKAQMESFKSKAK